MVSRPFVLAVMISVVGIAVCAREASHADANTPAPASSATSPVAKSDSSAIANQPKIPEQAAPRSSESAFALSGAHYFFAPGKSPDPDAPLLENAMSAAYARMRDSESRAESPQIFALDVDVPRGVIAYSGATPHDADAAHVAKNAIVFLHGYGGRFALPCWQVAESVRDFDVITACPSFGIDGDWALPAGESIVRKTVDALHARGVTKVILAGLSNGAIGVSSLISRVPSMFDSAILISGAEPNAPDPHVPVLVIQGMRDTMSPAWIAQTYARRAKATWIPLDAGHLAMLTHPVETEQAIHDFVRTRVIRP